MVLMPLTSSRLAHPAALIVDAHDLRASVLRLQALLQLQRDFMARIEDRFYGAGPAATAARRLVAVKVSEERGGR